MRRLSIPDGDEPEPLGGHRLRRPRALLFTGLAGASVLVTFPSFNGTVAAVLTSVGVYLVMLGSTAYDGSPSRLLNPLSSVRWLGGRLGGMPDADPTLPFAIDLLAVCLRGGLSTSAALRSVADVVGGIADSRGGRVAVTGNGALPDISIILGRAAAASELGSEPATAWREWVGHPVYGPLARAVIVTGESGSAVAARLESVAKQLRNAAGHRAIARAQRAGVALMAPLGLCFLPAFVCLGVVPVVVGIAGRVFG